MAKPTPRGCTSALLGWVVAAVAVTFGWVYLANYAVCDCGYSAISRQISVLNRIGLVGLAGFGYFGLIGALFLRSWHDRQVPFVQALAWIESLVCLGAAAWFLLYPAHQGLTAAVTRPMHAAVLVGIGIVLALLRARELRLLKADDLPAVWRIEDWRAFITLVAVVYWLVAGLRPWILLTHDKFTAQWM